MDDSKKNGVTASPLRSSPRQAPVPSASRASVSELCTLAPWDELAAFKKEVQLKLEEVFVLAHERQEGEARLLRTVQQTDAKVERFARQTRGLHSRSEVFEGHLTGQAKELDACREAQEELRDKVQRAAVDWTNKFHSNMSSMHTEMEVSQESVLEACRCGDRAIADELLRKMGELNEKLGANMLSLEEEVAADFQKLRSEVERQDAHLLEGIAGGQVSMEQVAAGLETRLREHAETHKGILERMQNEHGDRHGDAEGKLSKLLGHTSGHDGRMSATEQAMEQLKDLHHEAAAQTAASLVRVRSETEGNFRDAVKSSREELREEMRTMREAFSGDMQGVREDFRSNLVGCRELAQNVQEEALNGTAELRGDFRTLCRDVCGMVEDTQKQVASVQIETEASCQNLQHEVDVRLKDVSKQLHENSAGANDQLVTLTETLSGTQQRLGEVCASATRLQSSMEATASDVTRCQTFVEFGVADVRRDAENAAERQESASKCQRDDMQKQFDIGRADAQERATILQKDAEDLAHRIVRAERAVEAQVTELREQLRERLRENAHDWAKLHAESQAILEERLQGLARQSDGSLSGLRSELAKAAATARDARTESERTCRRSVEELAHSQEAEKAVLADAVTDLRGEMQSIRGAVADQAQTSVGRSDQLVCEVQKQTEDLKHATEELEFKFDEQFNALASSTRLNLQDSRQEMRQHLARQLDERMQPLSDRLTESAGDVKATKRSQNYCERLQKTCSELVATQESLAHQCSSNAQELTELRVELRGGGWHAGGGGVPRERSLETRAFRDERNVRSESLGLQSGVPTSLGLRSEAEVPAHFGDTTLQDPRSYKTLDLRPESSHDLTRPSRVQSQDRWSLSGSMREPQRQKLRSSFHAVLGASPLRKRESETFVPSSRTPSPPQSRSARLEENWTFGSRPQENQWRADLLDSARGGLLGGMRTLATSPPQSPRSFRAIRGSYL